MQNEPEQRKTTKSYWAKNHELTIRLRLPSRLNIGTANILRLLQSRIPKGCRVLEIGFAPGKVLAYVGKHCNARLSGIDFSDQGVETAKKLFLHLGLQGDLRCEDLFASTLSSHSFDFVYSLGFVEHFDNPALVVKRHYDFLAPGGRALIAIPNYGGIYGRIQARLDPENIQIHNLEIMREEALVALVAGLDVASVKAYPYGHLNLGLLSLHRKAPHVVTSSVLAIGNLLGLLQVSDIPTLCPLWVLEFERKNS
jgi:SAM-dependent methyltransferase